MIIKFVRPDILMVIPSYYLDELLRIEPLIKVSSLIGDSEIWVKIIDFAQSDLLNNSNIEVLNHNNSVEIINLSTQSYLPIDKFRGKIIKIFKIE